MNSSQSKAVTSPPLKSETPQQSIEDKMNYVMEDVSKFLTIFITIYMALILSQSPQINDFIFAEGGSLEYWEFLWTIPGIAYSYGLYLVSTKYLVKLFKPYLKTVNYKEGESEDQRLVRVGVNLMGFLYYTSSFITLFYLSYNTEFLPKVYGGYLSLDTYTDDWPVKTSKVIRIVYMICFGHHIERLIVHTLDSRHSKSFHTMNLHHLLTVYLIALSFFMNHFIFGVAVFLLHDLSDALLWASRLLRETVFEKSTITIFITMAISWFFTRVYSFLYEVIYRVFLILSNPKMYIKTFYFSHLFFFTSLFLLAGLNLYWFVQIVQIAITKFIKKKDTFAFEDSRGNKKSN